MSENKINLIKSDNYSSILMEVVSIIEQTKSQVLVKANSSLTLMYWHIGGKINSDILENNRAEYGKQILVTLSRELTWSHFVILNYLNTKLKPCRFWKPARFGIVF